MITTAEGSRPRRDGGESRRRVTLPDLDGFWTREEDAGPDRRHQARVELLRYGVRTQLTPRQRQVVDRYYHRGLTLAQTARELELSCSTVCRHLQAARGRLRQLARQAHELEALLGGRGEE